MTNREWVNSLSDEDFVAWLLFDDVYNSLHGKCEEPNPKLHSIISSNISSYHGLLDWLKEERKK